MADIEYPTIASSHYGSTSAVIGGMAQQPQWMLEQVKPYQGTANEIEAICRDALRSTQTTQEIMENTTQRRIVQVFIADPNDNVPLDSSLLYRGEQKLTDCNDQELFFEIPIADTLKKHNEFRKNVLDKEASKKAGKDVYLEPARIRDLKMTVVTIAAF